MALAVLTFLVAVAFVPLIASAATSPRWWVMALGAAVLIFAVRVRMTWTHWVGAAFVLGSAATLAWSPSPWDTAGAMVQLAILALVFCIAAEARTMTPVYAALAAGVTISAAMAVYQTWTGFLWGASGYVGETYAGLFLNKNLLAEISLLALIPMLAQGRYWLAVGPFVGCLLPGARETAISLLCMAAAALIAWMAKLRGWKLAAMLTVLAVELGGFLVFAYLDLRAFPSRLDGYDGRLVMWQVAWANTSWAGVGLGTFGPLMPQFEWAHNEFLHLSFEVGAVSVLLWVIVFYAMGVGDAVERSILAALVGSALVSYPLHMPATAFVAAVVAGHVCGVRGRLRAAQWRGRMAAGGSLPVGRRWGLPARLCRVGGGGLDVPAGS